jgi:hypothetical protein
MFNEEKSKLATAFIRNTFSFLQRRAEERKRPEEGGAGSMEEKRSGSMEGI